MKTHKALTILTAVAVVGLIAGVASARRGDTQQLGKPGKALRMPAFSAGGEYSGTLGGSVMIGSTQVTIAPDATIYQAGVGPLNPGESVSAAYVYVSGIIERKKPVATFVMVSDVSGLRDFSQTTIGNMEADPNRAE
jgi:hypothetical protein